MSGKPLRLTAMIEREDEFYIATCLELNLVSQGETVEAARANLLEAVEAFLESAALSEIRRRLKKDICFLEIIPNIPGAKLAAVA